MMLAQSLAASFPTSLKTRFVLLTADGIGLFWAICHFTIFSIFHLIKNLTNWRPWCLPIRSISNLNLLFSFFFFIIIFFYFILLFFLVFFIRWGLWWLGLVITYYRSKFLLRISSISVSKINRWTCPWVLYNWTIIVWFIRTKWNTFILSWTLVFRFNWWFWTTWYWFVFLSD